MTKESDRCGQLSLLVKFFGFNPIPPKWTFILTGGKYRKEKICPEGVPGRNLRRMKFGSHFFTQDDIIRARRPTPGPEKEAFEHSFELKSK